MSLRFVIYIQLCPSRLNQALDLFSLFRHGLGNLTWCLEEPPLDEAPGLIWLQDSNNLEKGRRGRGGLGDLTAPLRPPHVLSLFELSSCLLARRVTDL